MVEITHRRLVQISAFAVAFALAGSGVALATPITYTEQVSASGTLGTTSFSDADLTIQWTGDTSGVTGGGGFFTNVAGASAVDLTISGVGSTVFTDDVEVFVNQGSPAAGFGDLTVPGSILDTFNAAFASYALATPIGPITDNPFIRPDLTFGTGLGGLNITSVNPNSPSSTFTATTTSPVPEPASMTLLGTGILTLVGRQLRRRRARMQ